MLSGKMLKEGVLTAARHLGTHKAEVDALNVFPVPDGDTGTNMTMTIGAAARDIAQLADESPFDEAAERAASAMLRGARGNSGVILSLIFRGFAKSVKGSGQLSGEDLAQALELGSQAAYQAVTKPTEGTILTVVRDAALRAKETAQDMADDALTVWRAALDGARESLAKTPTLLPVLRQAGVVDAGGQGLVYIMEGFLLGFLGKGSFEFLPPVMTEPLEKTPAALSKEEIKFTYCNEFLVNKKDNAQVDIERLREALSTLGDCVVVADGGDVIKGHVHSNAPDEVLRIALEYGSLAQVKVENMRLQHEEAMWAQEGEKQAPVKKRYGLVAVAAGEGVTKLLRELGTDEVISGGQSMNPSTDDILRAINLTPAEHIFVLPNNKNIVMAADQAASLAAKEVSVLRTNSVVEGISAVLAFDETADISANMTQMQYAVSNVQTGLVTYAVRNSSINGLNIPEGSVIGLENGKLTVTAQDIVSAVCSVTQKFFILRLMTRRMPGCSTALTV